MGLVESGKVPQPLTKLLTTARKASLWVYQWGLACCAIEMGAAFGSPRYDVMRLGVIPLPASPRQADLVVISGTVTDKIVPNIRRLYEQMPDPKYVISMGSCANCGGPYWDSYSVTKGVDQIIPVDVYVPGCPPRPEAPLDGIDPLQRHVGIHLKSDVPDDTMTMPSWVRIYAGANWHERETWEMFGITFEGHPDIRHIYLPTEFEGHPLRKDFPLLTRVVKPWPGIVDVEPMPGSDVTDE